MSAQSYAEHEFHEAVRWAVVQATRGRGEYRLDPAAMATILRTWAQRLDPADGPSAELPPLDWIIE
jgi:hypothetical protein